MHVPRPDDVFFGYYVLEFSPESRLILSNLLLAHGFNLRVNSCVSYVSALRFRKINEILKGKVEYSVKGPFGLYGAIKKFIRRPIALVCSTLFLLVFILSSFVVWDIRIEGVESELHDEIYQELESAGLSVGKFWASIDKSEVENQLLLNSETVSWININRRGTVAYIKVVRKLIYEEMETPTGYANVVAERDCVIEEIRVKNGYALVKVGETVKAGQILISGVFPSELGGGLCYADGVVIGRYSGSTSLIQQRYDEEKELVARGCESYSIKIFGFSLKVFKKYRNLPNEYDIIKDIRQVHLPNGRGLPFSVIKNFYVEYEMLERRYTDDEIVKLAHSELREALSRELEGRELVRIKTSAKFVGEDYFVESEYVCRANVGKTVDFFAEKTE